MPPGPAARSTSSSTVPDWKRRRPEVPAVAFLYVVIQSALCGEDVKGENFNVDKIKYAQIQSRDSPRVIHHTATAELSPELIVTGAHSFLRSTNIVPLTLSTIYQVLRSAIQVKQIVHNHIYGKRKRICLHPLQTDAIMLLVWQHN